MSAQTAEKRNVPYSYIFVCVILNKTNIHRSHQFHKFN